MILHSCYHFWLCWAIADSTSPYINEIRRRWVSKQAANQANDTIPIGRAQWNIITQRFGYLMTNDRVANAAASRVSTCLSRAEWIVRSSSSERRYRFLWQLLFTKVSRLVEWSRYETQWDQRASCVCSITGFISAKVNEELDGSARNVHSATHSAEHQRWNRTLQLGASKHLKSS